MQGGKGVEVNWESNAWAGENGFCAVKFIEVNGLASWLALRRANVGVGLFFKLYGRAAADLDVIRFEQSHVC